MPLHAEEMYDPDVFGQGVPAVLEVELKSRTICALSGNLASPCCPQTVSEWFLEGSLPQEECDWHRQQGMVIITRLPPLYQDWLKEAKEAGQKVILLGQADSPLGLGYGSGQADHLSGLGYRDDREDENGNDDTLTEAEKVHRMVSLIQPVENLHLALDPRIPDTLEKFPLIIEADHPIEQITWLLNDIQLATTGPRVNQYLWAPQKGRWTACARIRLIGSQREYQTNKVTFWVK